MTTEVMLRVESAIETGRCPICGTKLSFNFKPQSFIVFCELCGYRFVMG